MNILNENGKLLNGLRLAQVTDGKDPHGTGKIRICDKLTKDSFWAFVVEGIKPTEGDDVAYAFHYQIPRRVPYPAERRS